MPVTVPDFKEKIQLRERLIEEAKVNIANWLLDIEAFQRAEKAWNEAESGRTKSAPRFTAIADNTSDVGAPAEKQDLPVRKPGRQRGQISKGWHAALEQMYLEGGASSYDAIKQIAERCGVKGAMAAVKERVRNFIAEGYLTSSSDNTGFVVTEKAGDLFGFRKNNEALGK